MNEFLYYSTIGNSNSFDDLFLRRLYYFYYNGGFSNILISNILTLFTNYFILFFINLITNCINYKELAIIAHDDQDIHTRYNITEFINLNKWFPTNIYLIICFIFYAIYIFCITLSTINDIRNMWKIKKIYTFYKINCNMQWNEIVAAIYPNSTTTELDLAMRILRQENIAITFYRMKHNNTDIFRIKLSKFLDWNFIYCFVNSLFDKNGNITDDTIHNYLNRVKNRALLLAIINIIAMPFILYIAVVITIIKYGEQFYNEPHTIIAKEWTIKTKWRIRYYNELPHLYEKRYTSIEKNMRKILNCEKNNIVAAFAQFIHFVLGSVFIFIIILSFVNYNILINCYFDANHNLLWVFSIITLLMIGAKKINTTSDIATEKYNIIMETIKKDLPSINENIYDKKGNYIKFFNSLYQYKITVIFLDIWYILLSPYYLYKWYNIFCKLNISNYIEYRNGIGYVAKKSVFYENDDSDMHYIQSKYEFLKHFPAPINSTSSTFEYDYQDAPEITNELITSLQLIN